ncbi:MAG: pilus assembly PilX family protein [Telluria sp.]
MKLAYRPALQRQRGITLIVALVMMVIITLLALTTFNLSKSSIQVVSNMQARSEGIAAARQVLDEAISNTRFFSTPNDALANPCNGDANTRCVDVNGDGVTDITVVLTPAPACVKAAPLKNSSVSEGSSDDVNCLLSTNQSFGIAGSVTGDTLCADSLWEITAVATDAVTQSHVEMVQGVTVRVPKDDVETSCPN